MVAVNREYSMKGFCTSEQLSVSTSVRLKQKSF